MNTLVIVLIAAVLLSAAYVLYGRFLAKKWGIDPNAKTPAVRLEDGQDYVPTDGWFSTISFPLSQVQALSPVLFKRQCSAGFLFSSGSSSAASSSAL